MALKIKRELNIDVVTAARQRIINVFNNGKKVYLSTSGGKDSIVLCDLVYKLIQEGRINPNQLEVVFIDEEAMYDDVIALAAQWRKRFMMAGVKFSWYCLEIKHFNCLRNLEDDETFVCWDRYQRENWCRPMPPFAITSHPLFRPRQENYQTFLKRAHADGIQLVGVRASEAIVRRNYLAQVLKNNTVTRDGLFYPIYDMTDSDIWLYIKENNLDFPKLYEDLYSVGVPRNRLRCCNFFAIDTVRTLSQLSEIRPELAEKYQRREPNAYMAQLYWDTEMFRRSSRNRRKLEEGQEKKDYKKLALEICRNPTKYTQNPHKIEVINNYKKAIIKMCGTFDEGHYKTIYESLIAGDTKGRTLRSMTTSIGTERRDSK